MVAVGAAGVAGLLGVTAGLANNKEACLPCERNLITDMVAPDRGGPPIWLLFYQPCYDLKVVGRIYLEVSGMKVLGNSVELATGVTTAFSTNKVNIEESYHLKKGTHRSLSGASPPPPPPSGGAIENVSDIMGERAIYLHRRDELKWKNVKKKVDIGQFSERIS